MMIGLLLLIITILAYSVLSHFKSKLSRTTRLFSLLILGPLLLIGLLFSISSFITSNISIKYQLKQMIHYNEPSLLNKLILTNSMGSIPKIFESYDCNLEGGIAQTSQPTYWIKINNNENFIKEWISKIDKLNQLKLYDRNLLFQKKNEFITSGQLNDLINKTKLKEDLASIMKFQPPDEVSTSQSPLIVKYKNIYASLIISNNYNKDSSYKYNSKTNNYQKLELVWAFNSINNNLSILIGNYGYYFEYLTNDLEDHESKEAIACAIKLIKHI